MAKSKPEWAKIAEKKLIDLEMNKKELAVELQVNHIQLCNVMSGYINSEPIRSKICAYLGI